MGWKLIKSAPKDGSWVLLKGGKITYGWDGASDPPCVVGQFGLGVGGYPSDTWMFAWFDDGFYGEYENPTHWMPVPE